MSITKRVWGAVAAGALSLGLAGCAGASDDAMGVEPVGRRA